jgi:hypothetical protein
MRPKSTILFADSIMQLIKSPACAAGLSDGNGQ